MIQAIPAEMAYFMSLLLTLANLAGLSYICQQLYPARRIIVDDTAGMLQIVQCSNNSYT